VLIQKHIEEKSSVTLATADMTDPSGYGRIIRDGYGNIQGIVEHNDCDEKQRLITELNPGYFCFQTPFLLEALDKITPNNVKTSITCPMPAYSAA
jgi:bifunctional UDP-N-acetylglucosamine pyrophosphorylase/glucosamine-1-phosphate N-acetyltransferase